MWNYVSNSSPYIIWVQYYHTCFKLAKTCHKKPCMNPDYFFKLCILFIFAFAGNANYFNRYLLILVQAQSIKSLHNFIWCAYWCLLFAFCKYTHSSAHQCTKGTQFIKKYFFPSVDFHHPNYQFGCYFFPAVLLRA